MNTTLLALLLNIFCAISLLAQSSQINTEANKQLLAAALHGNVQDIKRSMALGAEVNCRDSLGNTPLNLVAKLSYFKLVKYFIEQGAEVNIANNAHITPLHWGVEYNNVRIVKLLLERGANINARDGIQETPLHYAGWTGNIESAKVLLQHGANPYTRNNTGVTPLDLSIRQEHKELEQLFRSPAYRKFQRESISSVQEYDLFTLTEQKKLRVHNRAITPFIEGAYKGLRFSEAKNDGVAWLEGVTFTSGTIEFDVRGRDVLQKSFVGVAFHGANDSTFDAVYFRPFNFHAMDSVRRIHAVQYISLPEFTWKKLRDERNGIFEKALENAPDPNGWFHVRLVVQENSVEVFVNNSNKACLKVSKLNTRLKGAIGLYVADASNGDFANLKISEKM
ncbi:MAG: ankyrin repeat domain-containing protein [Candidatus Kapabacteria bacterium]|jgi:hypothetical protein|nr:ankyrin repeat domain-containing protein [Candidatus Kapabacteria bacterium]